MDLEESYVVFIVEDWISSFIKYLANDTLLQKLKEMYKLKKLATCYILQDEILFKKGYDGDSLWRLGPKEAMGMLKEVYSSECREHECTCGPKRGIAEYVKKFHGC